MKVFYDFEFIDDGRTIEPISVGMVDEEGNELYLINQDVDKRTLARHHWLMGNVVPHLPLTWVERGGEAPHLRWSPKHPDADRVVPRTSMARRVREFLTGRLASSPELWAWYGAYDHVALAQLFGPMSQLPNGIPMWTNDLRQVMHLRNDQVGILPRQECGEHRAIDDARWNKAVHDLFVSRGWL